MYKLKKEARNFFDENLAKEVKPLKFWKNENIHINLLEEVDNVYVEYGIKRSETVTDLRGWESGDGNPKAHLNFTVYIRNLAEGSYNSIDITEMMDEIQKTLNRFCRPYLNS
jgi:hypothetical protein